MQCIVYWGPQFPGSEGAPNHLAPALRRGDPNGSYVYSKLPLLVCVCL